MAFTLTNSGWYEQELIEEFTTIVNQSFPEVGRLLKYCSVQLVQSFREQSHVHFVPYIVIYCPNHVFLSVRAQISVFRQVVKYIGLAEVICLNASRLLQDPKSRLKQDNPQLWLELQWIIAESANIQ
ncbi:hypothetical protein WA1_17585 [Scytonema hofmannii PCC 7110]|uniref:Uncharacterized protein n=1 Tax=Scytonema hofmannii PCC 7110 TaxID=128403 RepID=A0A139XAX5_9CYAN|nr:hypothetical protein [Scytonema hofmannii]KYC41835.1 hypothetical protein WA1_17585 [Scytonema hofmannii PCC 7110]